MCNKATQSQQRTKNRKKCWEMTGEPDATAKASSSAGNKNSRPLCETNSSLKGGIQRRQDLAEGDYGDKSQALVIGCHRYTGCPTGQRATENKNVILILSIT